MATERECSYAWHESNHTAAAVFLGFRVGQVVIAEEGKPFTQDGVLCGGCTEVFTGTLPDAHRAVMALTPWVVGDPLGRREVAYHADLAFAESMDCDPAAYEPIVKATVLSQPWFAEIRSRIWSALVARRYLDTADIREILTRPDPVVVEAADKNREFLTAAFSGIRA